MAKATLEQWRMFKAVVDHGGFAGASAAVHKSQSTVHHAVQKLEAALQIKLLEVKGRKAFLIKRNSGYGGDNFVDTKSSFLYSLKPPFRSDGSTGRWYFIVNNAFICCSFFSRCFFALTMASSSNLIRLSSIRRLIFASAISSLDALANASKRFCSML